jgi:transposase
MAGSRPTNVVRLSETERAALEELVHRGEHMARELNRARILLWADQGRQYKEIARLLTVSRQMVSDVVRRYVDEGLERALFDRTRNGRPKKLGPKEEAMLTALACSEAPEGRERWTLFLLRDELVQLSELDEISHESVRQALKKIS